MILSRDAIAYIGFELIETIQSSDIGNIMSVYIRDPDENLIEISNYLTE